jgi:hypothetical protein
MIWAAVFSADGAPIARFFASALRTPKIFATSLSKRDEHQTKQIRRSAAQSRQRAF